MHYHITILVSTAKKTPMLPILLIWYEDKRQHLSLIGVLFEPMAQGVDPLILIPWSCLALHPMLRDTFISNGDVMAKQEKMEPSQVSAKIWNQCHRTVNTSPENE